MYVSQHGAPKSLSPGIRSVKQENRRMAFFRRKPSAGRPDGISLHAPPGKFHEPFPDDLATRGFRLMICGASDEQKC